MRLERDSLGEVEVPDGALYGPQTARAVENFAISGRPLPGAVIAALGEIKAACAVANGALGLLGAEEARAIEQAALEVASGRHDAQFPVDVFQTGSGTSSNMNANEVIANRANALLGGTRVHPNDHVNKGQSSNDVFPTALHLAAIRTVDAETAPGLSALAGALEAKAKELDHVVKLGRTHLVDAVPVRLGQELSGWAAACRRGLALIERAREDLLEVPLGGTAVGTGLNRHPELPARALAAIAARTKVELRPARVPFEQQAFRDTLAALSAAARTAAGSLAKIANDLRLLASGPKGGLGEIKLPALQPGSSIMPGKVNPVIPEAARMVWARVVGNDATVALSAALGELELNVMMPVIGEALLDSLVLLGRVARALGEKCVAGIVANEERCRALALESDALVTALAPGIGYEKAAEVVKHAARERVSIADAARALGIDPTGLLDLERLTRPG